MLSGPPGSSKAQTHTGFMKVLKPPSPWRWLPFHSFSCLQCPCRYRGQVRQDGGGRFQPKAGLGTEASDIQVTRGPSLSHIAKTDTGGGCGKARDTKTPPCLSQAVWPGGPPTFPSSTVAWPSFSGEGGLRPLVLLQIQGRAGPGRASLVLTAKGAMAG